MIRSGLCSLTKFNQLTPVGGDGNHFVAQSRQHHPKIVPYVRLVISDGDSQHLVMWKFSSK